MPVGALVYKGSMLSFANLSAQALLMGDNDESIDGLNNLSKAIESSSLQTIVNSLNSTAGVHYQAESNSESKPLYVDKIMLGMFGEKCSVCILQDRSVFAELEKEKIAKEYTKKFFAMITHELRNPLQGVLGIFESFMGESNLTEYSQSCKMGISTIKLMMRLVNDLLDLSQMESGKFCLSEEEFNINELIEECVDLMQFKYRAKNVDLAYAKNEQIRDVETVKCDKNRYKQIVLNLLGNALKFTEKGQVTIKTAYDSDANKLLTTVSDTGVGIKEEDKEKLFNFFGKLTDKGMLNPQGAGLGLYICKKLSEAMGGNIELTSEYMKGTSITFSIENKAETRNISLSIASEEERASHANKLPTHDEKTASSFQRTAAAKVRDFKTIEKIDAKPKVLVVDDEPICAKVLQSYLRSLGIPADTVFFNRVLLIRHVQAHVQSN